MPRQLEWLEDALPGRIQMHISGAKKALIENYLCVLAFSSDKIHLLGKNEEVVISGCGLSLCEVRTGAMIIRGDISEICMTDKRGAS